MQWVVNQRRKIYMIIKKTMEKALCLVMLTLCVVMAYVTTVQANNYTDTTWSFSVSNSTATHITSARKKEDTSKVYIKNLASSDNTVSVSILGSASKNGEYDNYTFNTGSTIRLTPYEIAPGTYKYMSSEVHEKCGEGAYAKLSITAYYTGNYNGLWSPDNKNGY